MGKFFDTWNKIYGSKVAKTTRDFLLGKDMDLSDEEYKEKYGYSKPIGGAGIMGMMVTPDFSGVDNIVKETIGFGGVRPNLGLKALETERAARRSLKTYDMMSKRDAFLKNRIGKVWSEFTPSEQYGLMVKFGKRWKLQGGGIVKAQVGGTVGEPTSILEPAIITSSPKTAKGKYRAARRNYRQAQRDYNSLVHDVNSFLNKHDKFRTDEEVAPFAQRLDEMGNLRQLHANLKKARDNYLSNLGNNPNNIFSQLYRYYSRHHGYQSKQNEENLVQGTGADIVDLSHNVIRMTPASNQSTGLFNEFVEKTHPSVLPASEYKENPDRLVGDIARFPARNISIYGGIEDGKFKLDSLKNFSNNTTVIPARNIKSGTPLIKQINLRHGQTSEDPVKEGVARIIANSSNNYPWDVFLENPNKQEYRDAARDLANNDAYWEQVLAPGYTPKEKIDAKRKAYLKYADSGEFTNDDLVYDLAARLNDNYPNLFQYIKNGVHWSKYTTKDGRDGVRYTFTDENGNEHPISDYNAAVLDGKTVLGNPNGGVFIGRIQDISKSQLDSLNAYLDKNPSWIMRPDLGSFDQYRLDNPSLASYLKQYFEHPKENDPNVYAIGTTTPNKLW